MKFDKGSYTSLLTVFVESAITPDPLEPSLDGDNNLLWFTAQLLSTSVFVYVVA